MGREIRTQVGRVLIQVCRKKKKKDRKKESKQRKEKKKVYLLRVVLFLVCHDISMKSICNGFRMKAAMTTPHLDISANFVSGTREDCESWVGTRRVVGWTWWNYRKPGTVGMLWGWGGEEDCSTPPHQMVGRS